eukprot:8420661-Pyramimonas_sp.AAC.1
MPGSAIVWHRGRWRRGCVGSCRGRAGESVRAAKDGNSLRACGWSALRPAWQNSIPVCWVALLQPLP